MTLICFVHRVLLTIFGLLLVSRRMVLARLRIAFLVSPIIMNCRSRLNQSCRVARNVECVLACSVAPVVLASFVRFVAELVWNAVFISAFRIVCWRIHMERPCMMLSLNLVLISKLQTCVCGTCCFLCPHALSCKHTFFAVQCTGLSMQRSRCTCSLLINTVSPCRNVACSHVLYC